MNKGFALVTLSLCVVCMTVTTAPAIAGTKVSQLGPAQGSATAVDPVNAYPEPPAGFDPLQATPAQLAQYGFPFTDVSALPPGVHRAYAHATTPVAGTLEANTTGDTSTPPLASSPLGVSPNGVSLLNSCNWSGKQLTIDHFDNVYSYWTVHNSTADGGFSEEVIWPGLGTGNDADHDLLQAGSREQVSGGSHWSFWYEVYPQISLQPVSTPILRAGDEVFVDVWRTSSLGNFFMENVTTGAYHTYTDTFPGGTGSTAEWIVERPLKDGEYTPLPFFDTQSMTNNYAFDSATNNWVSPGGLASHNSFTMYNINHDILVHTNGLTGADNQNFQVTRTNVVAGGGDVNSYCGP